MTGLPANREIRTALKFAAVGLVGFLIDISVLRLGMRQLHLSAFAARALSLTCAMQVTFLVNGLVVFRRLTWRNCGRRWLAYMASNGLGNLINYLVFIGLVASRWPQVSRHGWAVVIGSVLAYLFNFACVRLMVFGRPRPRRGAARSSSRPAPPMCPAAE
jgi:putative flippase GtrA